MKNSLRKTKIGPRNSTVWQNWSKNNCCTPSQIFSPRSAEEGARFISKSRSLRYVGAGHSFSALVPENVLVSAKYLNEILIDEKKMEVEAGAGVKLYELNRKLVKAGFALSSTGDIDEQTIAGLISTATKGTGIQFGSFSDPDCLLGLSLVTADGILHKIDLSDVKYQEVSTAIRLGLGCFGFITSVRLKICRAFNLKEENIKTTLGNALQKRHYLENYRYSFYYYPHVDICIQRIQNKTTEFFSEKAIQKRNFLKSLMQDKLANLILNFAALKPSLIPRVTKMFVDRQKNDTAVGRWDQIMISKRTMRYLEMQYSIPIENLELALSLCRKQTQSFASRGVYFVDLPIYVRYSRGDEGVLLSPSKGKDKLYAQIDFNCHHAQKNAEQFLQEIEQDLLRLGGRPHWGKMFYTQAAALYPEAKGFELLRRKWDPENKFQNEFIKKQFGDLFESHIL